MQRLLCAGLALCLLVLAPELKPALASAPAPAAEDCRLGLWRPLRGESCRQLELDTQEYSEQAPLRGLLSCPHTYADQYVFEDADGRFSVYAGDGSLGYRLQLRCRGDRLEVRTQRGRRGFGGREVWIRSERDWGEVSNASVKVLSEQVVEWQGKSARSISADPLGSHQALRFDVPGAESLNAFLWERHLELMPQERWCRMRFAEPGKPVDSGGSGADILAWGSSLISLRLTEGACGGMAWQWRSQTLSFELDTEDASTWRDWLLGFAGLSERQALEKLSGSPWLDPARPTLMQRYLEHMPQCEGQVWDQFGTPVITPEGMEFQVTLAHSGSYIWECQDGALFPWAEIYTELAPKGRELMHELASEQALRQVMDLDSGEHPED